MSTGLLVVFYWAVLLGCQCQRGCWWCSISVNGAVGGVLSVSTGLLVVFGT